MATCKYLQWHQTYLIGKEGCNGPKQFLGRKVTHYLNVAISAEQHQATAMTSRKRGQNSMALTAVPQLPSLQEHLQFNIHV